MENKDIRVQTERQLLAILLTYNNMFEVLLIKPQYLSTEEHRGLLNALINCYQKYKVVTPKGLFELDNNFEYIDYIVELYDTQLLTSDYNNEFYTLQKDIIDYYKEDIINKLNKQLEANEISYATFVKKINRLQEIQIIPATQPLSKKDLIDNITISKKEINIKNFNKLSKTLKLVQGDFLVVGATTGSGKSGLLLNFMNGLMDEFQCIYFNMEMSISTIYKRILSIRSGVPINYLNNPSEYQSKLINNASSEIEKNSIYIEHKATDIISIKSIIKKVKNPNKHTIVFVDHLGLVRCDKKNLYEQATEVSKQLRQICLDYDCTIIAASQLNRSAYNSEEITLSMLKDSGELENSASKVILLYRDKEDKKDDLTVQMYLDIAKNRDGQIGIIKTTYDKTKQIFTEKESY